MTDEEYYKIIHNLNVKGFTKLMSDYQVEVMKTLVTISEVHNVDPIEVMKTFGRCVIDSAEKLEKHLDELSSGGEDN